MLLVAHLLHRRCGFLRLVGLLPLGRLLLHRSCPSVSLPITNTAARTAARRRTRRGHGEARHARPSNLPLAAQAIERAVQRGQVLTRQLLTFSRRQTFSPTVFHLAERVEALRTMLASSLGGGARRRRGAPAEHRPNSRLDGGGRPRL
jgi:hypothetical protein